MINKSCALVTGSAARIGASFAHHLATQGYQLALHYNNNVSGAEKIAKQYESASLHQADFSDPKQACTLIDRVFKQHHSIDLLINNASVFPAEQFEDVSATTMLNTYSVNTVAPLLLIQALAAKQSSCHIVNLLDSRISHKRSTRLAYNLSKRALQQITLECAHKLAPEIRVNAICPGPVLPSSNEVTNSQESFQQIIGATPLKQQTQIADLLAALDYLNQNQRVTGEILYVDSGQHLD